MKFLLDENLPHDLRHFIPGHEVFTVAFMGWAGVKNGDLLQLAAARDLMRSSRSTRAFPPTKPDDATLLGCDH